ncbi:MAG: mechanosensitive ion channel family protein [Paramuribaculum sp.]|nr:mechanosensitive ion channel family protein [Paramuribaculum sp.]
MTQTILDFLNENITGTHSSLWIHLILLGGIAALSVASYYIVKLLGTIIRILVSKSRTKWDDDMLNDAFLQAVGQLAPALVVSWLLPKFFSTSDVSAMWIGIGTRCYILWTVIYIVCITISNLYNAFYRRPKMRAYAIKGIFQMVKLIVIILGVILTVSILIEKSPAAILTAIGASAAILMLVFKDTILGLVASVQLTANHMLKRGDWVVVDKHDANGEVTDVSLTTVKVRNWDNSITTIPPYSLVSESFRNYQPMVKGKGRRVERAIYIDVNSVGFCSTQLLNQLAERGFISEATAASTEKHVNLTLLREYLERYLSQHRLVNADMLYMVRQMEPTPSGLPLQLYFFTYITSWKEFEHVQCDIFDHVYATIGEFGLRVFQTPAGTDIAGLTDKKR